VKRWHLPFLGDLRSCIVHITICGDSPQFGGCLARPEVVARHCRSWALMALHST